MGRPAALACTRYLERRVHDRHFARPHTQSLAAHPRASAAGAPGHACGLAPVPFAATTADPTRSTAVAIAPLHTLPLASPAHARTGGRSCVHRHAVTCRSLTATAGQCCAYLLRHELADEIAIGVLARRVCYRAAGSHLEGLVPALV